MLVRKQMRKQKEKEEQWCAGRSVQNVVIFAQGCMTSQDRSGPDEGARMLSLWVPLHSQKFSAQAIFLRVDFQERASSSGRRTKRLAIITS